MTQYPFERANHLMVRVAGRISQVRQDRGASLVEYALLVALIAVVCIAAITFFGSAASSSFSNTASSVSGT